MEKLGVVLMGIVLNQGAQGESCPNCMHVEYTLSGLPLYDKNIMETLMGSVFSKLNVTNPNCISGEVATQTCPAPPILTAMVNKCQETQVTLRAKGLGIIDTAEMEFTVWVRDCIPAFLGETDKCTKLRAMDLEQMKTVEIDRAWKTANYSGRVCTRTPR